MKNNNTIKNLLILGVSTLAIGAYVSSAQAQGFYDEDINQPTNAVTSPSQNLDTEMDSVDYGSNRVNRRGYNDNRQNNYNSPDIDPNTGAPRTIEDRIDDTGRPNTPTNDGTRYRYQGPNGNVPGDELVPGQQLDQAPRDVVNPGDVPANMNPDGTINAPNPVAPVR